LLFIPNMKSLVKFAVYQSHPRHIPIYQGRRNVSGRPGYVPYVKCFKVHCVCYLEKKIKEI